MPTGPAFGLKKVLRSRPSSTIEYANPRRNTDAQPFLHRIIASRISITPGPYNPMLSPTNIRNSTGFNVSIANELEPVRYSGMPGEEVTGRELDGVEASLQHVNQAR